VSVEQGTSFGTLLRRYRKAAGLTQEALAEHAHLSTFTISALERGANQTPRRETLLLLAEALGLSAPARTMLDAAASSGAVEREASGAAAPFVGREQELALLERHLASEGPPVLLLAGEPGIGKSRLLQEAASRAAAHGLVTLQGGCRQRGGQEPYAPLPEVLRGQIRRQCHGRLRSDLDGCAWLVKLLPELADSPIPPLPAWTVAPEQERHLMVAATAHFLANVGGTGGVLLLLDDLQWADADALDLLRALVQSDSGLRLRVIGGYRDTEVRVGEALSALLADLASAALAAHYTLAPLTAAQTGQLVDLLLEGREEIDPAVRERVVTRSGGVPFFALSCLQGLQLEANQGAPAVAGDVPWTVAQSVRQRVAALPPPAQDVLRAAAIFGRSAPRSILVALAGRPQDEVLDALDAACQSRLLEEDGSEAYRFAHDVVREVVEGDLSAARRAALHHRVAEVLEAQPGSPSVEALAYHYAQSDAADKAVLYLEQAGDLAMARSAPGAAEGYYRDLARRLEAQGRHLDAAHAFSKLGLLLEQSQNIVASIAALQQAEETFAQGRSPQTSGPSGTMVLDQYAAAGADAVLYLASAVRALYQDHLNESMALSQRAVEMAREADDVRLQAQALVQRGHAELKSGRLDEALVTLEEARRLSEDLRLLSLLNTVLNGLFFVHELRGDFEQAGRCNAQNMQLAEMIGDPALLVAALFPRACLEIDTGEWERGRGDLEYLIEVSPEFAADSSVNANFGYLSMLQGDWVTATAQLQQALDRSASIGDMSARVMVERMLAEFELLKGSPDAALARLHALLALDEVHDMVFMLPLVAWAHLQMGDLDEADTVSTQALDRARAEVTKLVLPDTLRVRALVLTERRRWAEAKQALEEGLLHARAMPCPYAEGRLLHAYGAMEACRGDPELARARLEEARTIFERLGARWDVGQVEQALANPAHGVRARPI
jgi:tetratricopeptide (TPR) repeat protein/transcriptional regulator with XRE-family HTH domain